MSDSASFPNLVPGFDFLQNLAKTAGMSMPSIGQWVAPTLNPEELEKRIEELRTVQFWLEQNAKMLGATIQALEVQRMTLSTLKTMNVQMADLRESLSITLPKEKKAAPAPAAEAPSAKKTDGAAAGLGGAIDPMQWWGALTQQFTQLASAAIKEGAANVGPMGPMGATRTSGASGKSAASSTAQAGGKTSATRARKAAKSAKTKAHARPSKAAQTSVGE